MPCFHPLDAYQQPADFAGKNCRQLVFQKHTPQMNKIMEAQNYFPLQVSCNQCVGCRLKRSAHWAMRIIHEADMSFTSCFITLTFDNPSLNKRENPHSLDVRDFQLFMKRLRKKFQKKCPYDPILAPKSRAHWKQKNDIRFFHCGEYGELNGRPHYHAILFNVDFLEDREFLMETPTGHKLWTSPSLSKLWPYGYASIGTVTFESAAYVARYIMKKVTGDETAQEERYGTIFDPATGEISLYLKPEYITMSRRPGIGKSWYDKYKIQLRDQDHVIINGTPVTPCKYYDLQMKSDYPYEYDENVENRKKKALAVDERHIKMYGISNNSPERLKVRKECLTKDVLDILPRNLNM